MSDSDQTRRTTIVYNRPAVVESVYSNVVEVRFVDNGLRSYVARGEVGR